MLALGLAGWQWMETRLRLAETQQEMAKRLVESDAVAGESRTLAKQAQEQLAALQGKRSWASWKDGWPNRRASRKSWKTCTKTSRAATRNRRWPKSSKA